MTEFWQKTTRLRLPYILTVAIFRSKGYVLGSKKVKTFAGLTSNDFAIKALLYRNRSIKAVDLKKL
jgi:hypothetical protein